MTQRSQGLVFRPRARLLKLLGDQLIRDSNIALFELVKNAYDADATKCIVRILHLDDQAHARIEVTDDGSGMSWDTVTQV